MIRKLSGLVFVLLLSGFAAAGAENMLKNGSFEQLKNGLPTHWRIIQRQITGVTHRVENAPVFDGKNAVSLENKNKEGRCWLIWGQSIPAKEFDALPPRTLLELSARVQAVGAPAQAKIYFESVKARRTLVKRQRIQPGQWTEIFLQFEKENIAYPNANVYLQLEGKGKIVYDKVFFGPVKARRHANLIGNGGGEQKDAKGIPAGWRQVKYNPVGELFLGKGSPSGGNVSFGISSPKKPVKPLGWGYFLGKGAFAGIAPGTSMTIKFDLTTFANPAVKVRCYAEFMDGKKYVGTLGADHSVYAGWEQKSFTFPMPSCKFTHCWVYFMLKTEGRACFDNVEFRQGKGTVFKPVSDDFCRVKNLPPRRTWYSPEKPEKLDVEFKISIPKLTVILAEIDGKTLKTWNFSKLPTGKAVTRTLDLPSLPEGAYEFIFKSGKLEDNEWFALRSGKKTAVHFTSDRYMLFKGKKIFPIAMAHPNRLGKAGLDGLRVYAESGINMISEYEIAGPRHAVYLNAVCNQFGFTLWLKEDFGARPHQKGAALVSHLKKLNTLAKMIDNFAGLQSDEAAWSLWPLESVRRHSKYRFKYMPDYYTWQCNAPRMTDKTGNPRSSFDVVRRYALAADVTGADIYPVPEGKASHNNLPNQTISCVGDYTDLVRKMVWDSRPVWMVLQAMSWREERLEKPTAEWPRPTKKQLRFMVWNAITHGATGICWYGHGAWTDQYSEWYRQFAEVNLELAAAAKIMTAGKAETPPAVPENTSVLARTGIRVFVNESGKKEARINMTGKWFVCPTGEAFKGRYALKPHEVLILTQKPLKLAPVKRFTPQKTRLAGLQGVSAETVLIDGEWAAHPAFTKGPEKTYFAKHIVRLDKAPRRAELLLSADDSAEVIVNGVQLSESSIGHRSVCRADIAKLLKRGDNTLEFKIHNRHGQTGVVFSLNADGKKFSSGKNTLFSLDGKTWEKAYTQGKPPVSPWGRPTLLIDIR